MTASLLSVEEAKAQIIGATKPINETETVVLDQAIVRTISCDISAKITQPPFDASAMDGYAVHADDCDRPGIVLRVTGEVSAGLVTDHVVTPGHAVRIFTGAPLPPGAASVLIQENTEHADCGGLRVKTAAKHGANIRRAGQDFSEGQILLRAGTQLDERRLSLAAAAGYGSLEVYRRVRVAVLATGNELVPPGTIPGPGQISASGSIAIAAIARENGAEVLDLGIARDQKSEIETAVNRARAENADILITIGGASVGDHDLVKPVLSEMGMALDFWKIAMRPGKPLMVGRLGAMQVLGLPGNPVSSFVCALVFVEPLLRKLGHLSLRNREASATLTEDLPANGPRQHYMRGVFTDEAQTRIRALASQDSSLLRSLANADCLIVRSPNSPEAVSGTSVGIIRLET